LGYISLIKELNFFAAAEDPSLT